MSEKSCPQGPHHRMRQCTWCHQWWCADCEPNLSIHHSAGLCVVQD